MTACSTEKILKVNLHVRFHTAFSHCVLKAGESEITVHLILKGQKCKNAKNIRTLKWNIQTRLNSPAPPSLDFLKPLTCLGGIYMSEVLSQKRKTQNIKYKAAMTALLIDILVVSVNAKCKAATTVAGLTLVPRATRQ